MRSRFHGQQRLYIIFLKRLQHWVIETSERVAVTKWPSSDAIRTHKLVAPLSSFPGASAQHRKVMAPVKSTQSGPDELIAQLLIFSSRYDRMVAGRLGGRHETRGRHR
jgi:hypothetical protein